MRTIRFRLSFVMLAALFTTLFCIGRASLEMARFREMQARASESLDYRAIMAEMVDQPYTREFYVKLQGLHRRLAPEARKTVWGDFVMAYATKDRATFRARLAPVNNYEQHVFHESTQEAAVAAELAEKFATLAVIAPLFGLFLVMLVVRRKILKPVAALSRRMKDFLIDRYSFSFSTPDASELGELQRTFNSLAQRVINTMDELKQLDQAKSEFLNIASHELRTPLTSIKGSLSLLAGGVIGNVDGNSMRLIKIAESETDRLIRLINDLLDLAKIEAGKLPLGCSWIAWDDVTSKTTEGLTGLATKANVRIFSETTPGLEVFMDRDRVQQVLTNLISNAIKFSPTGASVRIKCGKTNAGELLVNVVDQGPGIAAADQEMIFQKFRQGTTAENPLVKGTGLGLAIAKALVAEHGGSIGVASEVGKGATFWFTLPKWRDDESASDEPARSEAA